MGGGEEIGTLAVLLPRTQEPGLSPALGLHAGPCCLTQPSCVPTRPVQGDDHARRVPGAGGGLVVSQGQIAKLPESIVGSPTLGGTYQKSVDAPLGRAAIRELQHNYLGVAHGMDVSAAYRAKAVGGHLAEERTVRCGRERYQSGQKG